MGKNTIGNIPELVARALGRADAANFSGHSWRRTAATLFVAHGGTKDDLKLGRWRSDTVAEGYVDNDLQGQIKWSRRVWEDPVGQTVIRLPTPASAAAPLAASVIQSGQRDPRKYRFLLSFLRNRRSSAVHD